MITDAQRVILASLAATTRSHDVTLIVLWTGLKLPVVRNALAGLKRDGFVSDLHRGPGKWWPTLKGVRKTAELYQAETDELTHQRQLQIRSAAAAYYTNK